MTLHQSDAEHPQAPKPDDALVEAQVRHETDELCFEVRATGSLEPNLALNKLTGCDVPSSQ